MIWFCNPLHNTRPISIYMFSGWWLSRYQGFECSFSCSIAHDWSEGAWAHTLLCITVKTKKQLLEREIKDVKDCTEELDGVFLRKLHTKKQECSKWRQGPYPTWKSLASFIVTIKGNFGTVCLFQNERSALVKEATSLWFTPARRF